MNLFSALVVAGLSCLASGCDREVLFPAGLFWDAPPPPSYITQPRLAMTVSEDDRLAFVSVDSLDSPRLFDRLPVGFNPIEKEGPHHLTVSPDGEYIYFNLTNNFAKSGSGPHAAHGNQAVPGYLVKLEVRTNRQLAATFVARNPGDVLLSQDGKLLFVSHYDLLRLQDQLARNAPEVEGYSAVYIVDAASMQVLSQTPVCPTGHGQGLSLDGQFLYLTCTQSDELAVLDVRDPRNPSVVQKVKVGSAPGPVGNPAYAPYAVAVHRDGTVWISNNASGDVRAFDPVKREMDRTRIIRVGGIPMFADFGLDGTWLYVPHQGDDRVTAIELATQRTVDLPLPPDTCLNAHALSVLPSLSGRAAGAAVLCEGDHLTRPGTVVFIDLPLNLSGWTVRGHVEVGLFPDGMAILPALP